MQNRQVERNLELILRALVRRTQNRRWGDPWERGVDERDVAVEAGFLTPALIDGKAYSAGVRRPILAALQEMEARGWLEVVSGGAWEIMRVRPTEAGERHLRGRFKSWPQRLLTWFADQRQGLFQEGSSRKG